MRIKHLVVELEKTIYIQYSIPKMHEKSYIISTNSKFVYTLNNDLYYSSNENIK